jgi:hypothetical protein
MKTHMPALAFVALTSAFYGCGGDHTAENAPITTTTPAGESTAPAAAAAERRDDALVRFVNAIPATAVVDLYADDTRTFSNVAFRSVTPYREVDGQRYTFRLQPSGTAPGSPLASNNEGLDDGDYYTVFAVPGTGNGRAPLLRVVEDDFSKPPADKARVRVVHASGDVGEISVFERGRDDGLFTGVDFQSVTGYDDVDVWRGPLDIRPDGQATVLASVPEVNFEPGKIYTVVVVGNVKAGPKLEAFVIEDQLGLPGATARN